MQPSTTQSSVITAQPKNNFSYDCSNRITGERFCNNGTVAASTIASLCVSTTGVAVGTKYAAYSLPTIIGGTVMIAICCPVTTCLAVQYCQNQYRPCNNPYLDHQQNCPHRNPKNFV